MRPGDQAQATVLAWQDELTALGLLPKAPGGPVAGLSAGRPRVPCGTPGAATRHRRKGEPLDEACADAERREQARHKAARRLRQAAA